MTDLISRQAAIAEAYNVVIDGSVFKVVQVETLYGLPTIEPPMTSGYVTTSTDEPPVIYAEQKHGKWFNTTTDIPNLLMNVCSECGFQYPSAIRPRFNYCPNCGSQMERSEDETD